MSVVRKISIAINDVKDILETKCIKFSGKFNKLDLPTFDEYLKTRFITLETGYDETTKKINLTNCLKRKAKKYVEDLMLHDGEYDDIWKQVNAHFGNSHIIIDVTIKSFFELPKPSNDIQEIEDHFTQSKNKCTSVLALEHTTEELLAAVYMLQLPGEVKALVGITRIVNKIHKKSKLFSS